MPLTIATSQARRWTGLPRGQRITMIILAISILLGGGLMLWARLSLSSLLTVNPQSKVQIAVSTLEGDCGTPALYIVPQSTGEGTDYRLLVDIQGGPNRFPDLGGLGTATSVLFLPSERKPGVGLGRGLKERCDLLELTITGDFSDVRPAGDFGGLGRLDMQGVGHVRVESPEAGLLRLVYDRPEDVSEDDALLAVTLIGVDDRWQFGHKRLAFENTGIQGVNIFLYEEQDYLFLNETFNPIRPPNIRRAYVDIHLESPDIGDANIADVVRQRPTAELELQNDLISISTIFGIGISLFVEGVLILLISLATGMGQSTPVGPPVRNSADQQSNSDGET